MKKNCIDGTLLKRYMFIVFCIYTKHFIQQCLGYNIYYNIEVYVYVYCFLYIYIY